MTTKIFVSQIDSTQPDGSTANTLTVVILGSNGPYWGDPSDLGISGGGGGDGYTGSVGFFGSSGYSGSVGYRGSAGATGVTGPVGYYGSAGTPGYTGSAGYFGSVGYSGSVGFYGSAGYAGSVGTVGFFGSLGFFGSTGYRGSEGATGTAGYFGSTGYRGSAGDVGSASIANLSDGPGTLVADKVLVVNSSATGVILTSNLVLNSANVTTANINTLSVSSITSNTTFNGTFFDFNDKSVVDPVFKGYGELVNDKGNSTASLNVNLRDGNIVKTTLNASVVTFTADVSGLSSGKMYSVTLFLKQDSVGSRIIDWTNETIYWSTAENINQTTGPILSTTPNYTDVVTLSTLDGGSTWFGSLAVKGFPTTA